MAKELTLFTVWLDGEGENLLNLVFQKTNEVTKGLGRLMSNLLLKSTNFFFFRKEIHKVTTV